MINSIEKMIKKGTKKKKETRNEAIESETKIPCKINLKMLKEVEKEIEIKSWTAVYQVFFSFNNGVINNYPIPPAKMASTIPSGTNMQRFSAAVIFLTSFFGEKNTKCSISEVFTRSNVICSGIKDIWKIMDILLSLISKMIDADLPIPIFTSLTKIDFTVGSQFHCCFPHKIENISARDNFKHCFRLNVFNFPTSHMKFIVRSDDEIKLTDHFSQEVAKRNENKVLSCKGSNTRLNTCGLTDRDVVFYFHKVYYTSFYNKYDPVFIKRKELIRKNIPEEERRLLKKQKDKVKLRAENAQISTKNERFKLFTKIYLYYIYFLKTNERKPPFNIKIN